MTAGSQGKRGFWSCTLFLFQLCACDCNCWDSEPEPEPEPETDGGGGGCGFECGWGLDDDYYVDMPYDDRVELDFLPDLEELEEYDAPDESIAEVCNGFDDDENGVVDDIDGTWRCGDDCCNGEETALDCPDDCVCEAPSVPFLEAPRHGQKLAPSYLVFLWRRSWGNCGAATYDLEVDDSCDVESADECLFPDPEIRQAGLADTLYAPEAELALNTRQPLPRRYFWRVRSCYEGEICSAWSPVRAFDAGAAENDLDGDGLGDVAVGVEQGYGPGVGRGRVYVFYANDDGVKPDPSIVLSDPSSLSGTGFAAALSAGGDFDGDALCDLVVGAESRSGEQEGEGAFLVYYGKTDGIRADVYVERPNPDHVSWSRFGSALAASGDLNGDGFSDLAVGARLTEGAVPYVGRVYVYYGSESGIGEFPDTVLVNPEPREGGQFGFALASDGDLDGDGISDLVVSAPYLDGLVEDEGKVFIYYGLSEGIREVPSVVIENPSASPGHLGMNLSSSGDVNADGFADLVIGAPSQEGASVEDGVVLICFGMPFSLLPSRCVYAENPEPGLVTSFGSSVRLTADVNGDGVDDAAAGALGVPGELGRLYIFEGSQVEVSASPGVTVTGPVQWFALDAIPVGDLGLDGTSDFVITGYLQTGPKIAYLYYGTEYAFTLNLP